MFKDKQHEVKLKIKKRGTKQLLEDSDGIKFAVASNIWDKDKIGSILKFAKSQGYDVVEYRDEE